MVVKLENDHSYSKNQNRPGITHDNKLKMANKCVIIYCTTHKQVPMVWVNCFGRYCTFCDGKIRKRSNLEQKSISLQNYSR